ncbi:MAG: transaldolase [Burkholderiaceae bacterium]|nr:transaldolase [Burkholderiaceae bacterium]
MRSTNTESIPNALEALKQFTTVVADTGNFESMRAYQPQDATTNPTLIIRALEQPRYAGIVDQVKAAMAAKKVSDRARAVLVSFGCEILKIIPGRVSTEVDARLSFDTQATIAEANAIIAAYAERGIPKSRVLIKIAATWEGLRAVRELEKQGIACNVTLIFSLIQAAAAADAGATLISPFVGRISDWHKKAGAQWATAGEDPGVQSVKRIYAYLKHHRFHTEVMGASFRSVEQVMALAGCDLLTVSPDLLEQLRAMDQESLLERALDPAASAPGQVTAQLNTTESLFRFAMNEDAMATEKLAEGIRLFVADGRKLDARLV